MKPRHARQKTAAWTLIELLVVVAVLFLFMVLIDFGLSPNERKRAQRVACVNNLKQIGIGYRLWIGDQGWDYQTRISVTKGGVRELVESGIAYVSYQVMSNELVTPKILICPAATNRFAATNFAAGFGNQNVSYFVGVGASECWPQSLLSGDDNFAISGTPVKSGLLDLFTNTPVAWTAARHKSAGNIGLSDSSVQQVNTDGLQKLLQQTGHATNRLALP